MTQLSIWTCTATFQNSHEQWRTQEYWLLQRTHKNQLQIGSFVTESSFHLSQKFSFANGWVCEWS